MTTTPQEWALQESRRLRALVASGAFDGMQTMVEARPMVAPTLDFLSRHSPGPIAEAATCLVDGKEWVVPPLNGVPRLAGLLEQWVSYIEDGMGGRPYQSQARIEAANDIMGQVQRLLSDRDVHPAAPVVLAGAALEEALRAMVLATPDLVIEGKPSISTFAAGLRKAGRLSRGNEKDITAWADQRNDAAHGHFDDLSRERAYLMADGINLFLRQTGLLP